MLSIKVALLVILGAIAADVALFDGIIVWIIGAVLFTLALGIHKLGCRIAAKKAAEQATSQAELLGAQSALIGFRDRLLQADVSRIRSTRANE